MKKYVMFLFLFIFACGKDETILEPIVPEKIVYFSVTHGVDKQTNYSFWGITLLTDVQGVIILKLKGGGEFYLSSICEKGKVYYYFEPNQFREGDTLCFVIKDPVEDPENQICSQQIVIRKTEVI